MLIFYDSDGKNFCRISLLATTKPEWIQTKLTFHQDGSEVLELVAELNKWILKELAQWLSSLWDECPPFEIPEIQLKLEFSHREHIGDGYFYIHLGQKYQLLVYEQLGSSNVLSAENFLKEISAY